MNLDYDDFEMGPITVNVGIMEISRNRIRVTLDSRFPVRYDINRFNKVFNELLVKYHLFIAGLLGISISFCTFAPLLKTI